MNRESLGATALIGSSEILAWGKGGMRSQKTQNRYSSLGGRNGRLCRSSRVSKLIESLQHSNENDAKVNLLHNQASVICMLGYVIRVISLFFF